MPNQTCLDQVSRTELYLPHYTYHRWHQVMYDRQKDTSANGVGTPGGKRTILNNVKMADNNT